MLKFWYLATNLVDCFKGKIVKYHFVGSGLYLRASLISTVVKNIETKNTFNLDKRQYFSHC